jgi:hypothetical protein
MRPVFDNDTIQIEITNACVLNCANCTRFVGHRKPYFMEWDQFRQAVDSMVGYPYMTGIMGGEPLLHPQFEKFCDYAVQKLGWEHLGLWSCFPAGYEKYREVVCRTFGHIFLNDHTRPDIYHHPFLVAIEDAVPNKDDMFLMIDHCFFQRSWSASINPMGAYFCEMAASLSILLGGNSAWKVEPKWWLRINKDYGSQIEEFCPKCGGALYVVEEQISCGKLQQRVVGISPRSSLEKIDDISPSNLKRLKGKSTKIDSGKYKMSDMKMVEINNHMAAYKDADYRAHIADRYGIMLVQNTIFGENKIFLSPYLKKESNVHKFKKPLFDELKEAYGK